MYEFYIILIYKTSRYSRFDGHLSLPNTIERVKFNRLIRRPTNESRRYQGGEAYDTWPGGGRVDRIEMIDALFKKGQMRQGLTPRLYT